MTEEEVLLEVDNYVAKVTLNRPSKGNSLNGNMGNQLIKILQTLEKDPKTRIVVLTGSGKYFCTGMDLSNKSNENKLDPKLLFHTLLKYPKPIIAKVNGPALGMNYLNLSKVVDGVYYLHVISELSMKAHILRFLK
jgi:methylglutaconyl-CoA hydratase